MLKLTKQIFVFIVLFIPTLLMSQDLGTWNVLNINYKYNNKLSFFTEAQLRSLKTYNDFHYYEYKGGVNLHVNQSAIVSLGAGSYQTYAEGGKPLH